MTRLTDAIRPYRPEDAPAIALLFHDAVHGLGSRRYSPEQVAAWSPASADPARWDRQFADGRIVLVSVDEVGEILAFATLEPDGHLDHLYASPDAAGTGVASRLLDRVIGTADAAGIGRLFTEASDLARGLFERKGFHVMQRREFEIRGVLIHNWAMERAGR